MGVSLRQQIVAAVRVAQQQCSPRAAVADQVWAFVGHRPLFVLAVGKSAVAMATGVTGQAAVAAGLIIATDGAVPSVPGFELMVASHPFPDQRSVSAAQRALAFVAAVPAHGVLLALISGGTSSLLAAPRCHGGLQAKVQVMQQLMAAGAAIHELNTVRATLSLIKAGGLVVDCAAPVVTWAISDVPGDDIGMIGSGPTVGDWVDVASMMPRYQALQAAAQQVLQRYGVDAPGLVVPRAIRRLDNVRGHDVARVIAPRCALADAIVLALRSNQPVCRLSLDEDSAVIARAIATGFAALAPGQWLVAHGEPTVRLPPAAGPGGRMRDVALRLAIE